MIKYPFYESRSQYKRTKAAAMFVAKDMIKPLYTCPRDAAAIGFWLISAKISEIGTPSWVLMDLSATWVGKGGI